MDIQITVALIAATASFLGLLISKEQRVSEFRQEWINRVRIDVASLIGQASHLANSWALLEKKYIKDKSIGNKFLNEKIIVFQEMDVLISRIKLSLNPEKDSELFAALDALEESSISPNAFSNLSDAANEVERLAHLTFKTEWERVKKGEPLYQITKNTCGVITLLITVYLLLNSVN